VNHHDAAAFAAVGRAHQIAFDLAVAGRRIIVD
jgi:hypothetical protein